MKILKIFLLLFFLAFLFSCQKEVDLQDDNNNTGAITTNIVGNYDFVGMLANTKSTVVAGTGLQQEKIITVSSYSSTNNSGTVAITTSQMNTTDIGYSIDGIAATEYYLGGVLLTSVDLPYSFTLPPTSGNSTYRRITNDSIYFDNGFISYDPTGSGNPTATMPIGAKLSWQGDTLLMRTVFKMTNVQDIGGGIMATVTSEGNQIVSMKKR